MGKLNRLGIFFTAAGEENNGDIVFFAAVHEGFYHRYRQFGDQGRPYFLKCIDRLHYIFYVDHAVHIRTLDLLEQRFRGDDGAESTFFLGIHGILICPG